MATSVKPQDGEDNPALSASAVVDRMKECAGVDTDSALAEFLHTSRANVSKWRNRGSVPYAEAVAVALRRNSSLDYILAGRGESVGFFEGTPGPLDEPIMLRVVSSLWAFGMFEVIPGTHGAADETEILQRIAKAIVFQQARARALVERLRQESELTPRQAEAAALAAIELTFSDGTLFGGKKARSRRKQ